MAHTEFATDGPIATLTFNRPEARNAMTWEMYEALVATCDRVDQDPAIRVLLFRGAGGKAFVAGTDIAQFQNFNNRDDGLKYEERLDAVLHPFGFAFGGNHVIPAPRRPLGDVHAEHTVGKGVAQMMVEEQPPVEFLIADFLLYLFQLHKRYSSLPNWQNARAMSG